MIKVEIRESKKLNDAYSAYVSFKYDSKIVTELRALPFKFYNASNQEWEIPITKLDSFVKKLNDFDFTFCGDLSKLKLEEKQVELPEGFEFKTKPFAHQLEGVEYGLTHDNWFLGDEQGCVSGDSLVKIKENGKPATRDIKIKYLKEAFKNDPSIQIKCMINERFGYLPIKAVVDKGIQKTITINLENSSLKCTPDHLIYTDKGWIEAGKLKVGDAVFTNGKQVCPICGSSENLITYPYSKFLGYCKSCMYKSRNGTKYNELTKRLDADGYVRLFGKATRDMPNYDKMYGMGIYEHHQVWYENTGHIVDTTKEVVHHKNGIKTDNRFENLQLLSIQDHDRLHSDTKKNHLYQFNKNLDYIIRNGNKIWLVPNLQTIESIEDSGYDNVWDISIDDEEIHNFICNNIVVHNCGKTKQAIDIAVARKLVYGYEHCLIVCGVNTLKWNWVNEVSTHSNEYSWILGQKTSKGKVKIGSSTAKYNDLCNIDSLPYFIITNVESFRDEKFAAKVAELCKKDLINMCVIDEFHKCKNPQAQQTKGFLKCLPKCKIGMTGTPLMNSPLDLYVILKWLGFEKHPFYAFKKHYCVMGGFGGYEIVGYKNMEQLTAQINEIMLRRLKSEVLDLPDKTYVDEYVEMGSKQAALYKEVEVGIKTNLANGEIDLVNPLSALIRLRQCTGYTGILSDTIFESAKLDRMEDLVEECVANNQKCIIFSNWTQMTDVIIERLNSKGFRGQSITGATKDEERQLIVKSFQDDLNQNYIVGTIGAMGTGLTLTAATTVIFMDEPWNRALYDQAVDRAHRIGQKNNITVYNLLTKDTIDTRIHNIVYKKGAISDAIIDGKGVMSREVFDYLLG